MKARKYTDFFEEAQKSMSQESTRRAEHEANKIMLTLDLAELRKHTGRSQSEVSGYRQSSISKIEARKDMKISTLVSYCRSLGGIQSLGAQLHRRLPPGKICSLESFPGNHSDDRQLPN